MSCEAKEEQRSKMDADAGADHAVDIRELDYGLVELGPRLGDGGVGMTFEGHYDGDPCAIKMLFDPRVDVDLKREFMDEVHVLASLRHPSIVRFLGAVTQPPNLCFAMELCDTSLFTWLHQDRRRLSPYHAVEMAQEIAEALAYMHSQSPPVIHRDLKSLNVLLTSRGRPKLSDFGLSRVQASGAGTPSYMAPELLRSASFGVKVDVYAFGVLLWELLTAQIPFGGLEVGEVKEMVLEGARPDLAQLEAPPALVDLVEDAMLEEQQRRPRMQEIVYALSKGLDTWHLGKGCATPPSAVEAGAGGGDALDFLMGK